MSDVELGFSDEIVYVDDPAIRVVCTCGARLKVKLEEDENSIIIRVLPHLCLRSL